MQIVIKKTYFDNIKVAIDSMNKFFASSFKTKAFPVVNDEFQLDRIITRTISWLNNIEPEWVDNPQKAMDALNGLRAKIGEKPEFKQEGVIKTLFIGTLAVGALLSIISDIKWLMKRKKYEKNTPVDQKLFDLLDNYVNWYGARFRGETDTSYPDPWDPENFEYDAGSTLFDFIDFLKTTCDRIADCMAAPSPLYRKFPNIYDDAFKTLNAYYAKFKFWVDQSVDTDRVDFFEKVEGGIATVKAEVEACMEVLYKFCDDVLDALNDTEGESVQEAADELLATAQNDPWFAILNGSDQVSQDHLHAFVGYKVLQYIASNFDQFENLLNGIYSFGLFTTPSQYREAIQVFTTPIPIPELDSISKFPGEYKLFDAADYVQSIFDNDQIKLPDDMMVDTEVQRFQSFTDLQNCEIVVDETVQEAAAVNYFKDKMPEHITYDVTKKKWKISKQFESKVNALLKKLRECDNTDDLAEYFSSIPESDVTMFADNVMPFIYANIFTMKKNKWDIKVSQHPSFKDYAKSYSSIIRKNNGAKRFGRYDIFTTFKIDKEGTIRFIEDFLKLNLVNDERGLISNNTILTLFNIFDSRIYLDILYNLIPDEVKQSEYPSEDGFVKKIRARINQNSRTANPYQKKTEVTNTVDTSETVSEYAFDTIKSLGDLSTSDMKYCDAFMESVYQEIDSIGDALYNRGVSSIKIDQYIGESYNLFEPIQEGFISRLKEKSKRKKINQIEKKLGEHLPKEFIEFINHPPKHGKLIKCDTGGMLGNVFTFAEMLAALQNTEIGKLMVQNGLLMFAEWYPFDDPDMEMPDDIEEQIKCLYLNVNDGSIMFSDNPFEIDNILKSDIKPFWNNIEMLLDHLDDWEGKPVFGHPVDSDEDEDEEVEETEETEEVDDDESIQEQETGDIPTYMKERIKISDEKPKKDENQTDKPNESPIDVQLPPDVPVNDFDDLADSINARLNTPGADSIEDMLGSGYQGTIQPGTRGGAGHVIYNITHNTYNTNSNNTTHTTTNDLSTGKTTTTTVYNNDLSSNKRTNQGGRNKPSNNYDNTRPSSNSKESGDTFSNGKSVQEVFALLDSKEPLFVESDAGTPPKGDLLTTAMDADRATLSTQQKVKRGVQKIGNTARAIVKPIGRTKQWMRNLIDSFVKRDEDRVKAELIENPSYRSAIFKVARIALKTGKFAIFSAISPALGFVYLGAQGLKLADRERLRREANDEIATEIQIIDKKIQDLENHRTYGQEQNPDEQKELYKLMRMRAKLVNMSTDANKRKFANTKSVY